MNTLCYFEIQSSNPEREMKFYHEVFGWKFNKVEGLPIQYFQIETVTLHGGLLERPAQTPPTQCGTNAFTCSFEVEDFDQTAEKILALGGRIAMEKFAIPNKCWQGYFLDADHNTFGLVQVDPNAQ
ncbi:VOC family protein [Acinetobacter bereziniae]|uniref:VOC family protein n=1 Tax=Acinetobacter TaxID=469 RepID=UPI001116D981|nr:MULTISPECIES: VOC family protein [Acinetobacter]MBJ8442619.1 VOC family protein [Acinetobacter bereziniae]MBJ9950815.1 VOC family protein [Acinetobacter bereziniae]MDQ9817843.1 VOC family protein [Acinetobacter bereziniae]TNL53690.1 VOC family protein [Acinetobacter bereziniae]TNL64864.1 VOC family protein [Acinetobacter bereziniae]